ncbi:unnamed protein product [Vitrella brassicaformis CCMP3155]|uniref:Uncharacterized protein n=1 Tax=Vitrella brassicaformis (strain CCMP3155) TaxID=1169540 RepID=A0A0G4ET41_VITBC|nr:unnamed protein product [Vitrella brassicaformis CCMP3155]|eukprot:CEM00998.1 unnamed protein product [Vitrella brassicaformis CCMP3155]
MQRPKRQEGKAPPCFACAVREEESAPGPGEILSDGSLACCRERSCPMSSEETKGDEGAERGLWEEEPLVLVDTKGNNCGYSIPLENSPDGLDFVVCQKAGSEGDFPLTGVPLTGRQVQPEDTAAGALLLDVMDSFKMAQSEVSDVLHKVVCTPGPCDGSLQSLRGMTDQEWEVLQVPRPLVKTIQDRINRASRDTSRGGQTIQRLRSKLMQREKQSTKMRQTDALEMTEDRQGNKRLDSDTEPDGDGSAVGAKERTSWQGKGGGEELVMTFDPPGSPDAATQRSPVVIRLPIPTTLEEKEEAGRELNRGLEKLQDAWRKPEGVHATEKES